MAPGFTATSRFAVFESYAGGGSGITSRPVGVYRIENGTVTWEPAVDVTRIAIVGQVVAIVALLVARSMVKRRRKR
jgi:hypothetical protein